MAKASPIALWQQSIIALSQTVIGLAIVVALSWGRPVLIPIALATLLTILLTPIVRRLQKLGLGRILAVILTVTSAGTALTAISVVGSREITSLLSTLPENTAKIITKLKTLKSLASGETAVRFERMVEDIGHELRFPALPKPDADESAANDDSDSQNVERIVLASEPMAWTRLTGHLGSVMEAMATLALTLVLLMFFLMERQGLRDRIVLLAGKARLTLTSKALEDATSRVSRYIVMVEIVNGSFGLLLTGGLFLMGVPYAVLWGCMAALFRFLPYIGPWIGAFFPITMSLAMSEGWWQPIAVFSFVMTLELFTNNVVEPILFGRTTGVAATALLISAAFWLFIWGPIGLVLSAPFAVSLVVIGKNIPQLGFLNVLLGDEPALADDMSFYQRLLLHDQFEAKCLVVDRMREPEPEHVFDDLMIPALNYAKRDLRRGHLNDEECSLLLQLLRNLFSDIDFQSQAQSTQESAALDDSVVQDQPKRLRLLGCAADGEIDRVALAMLQKLLDPAHWDMELVAAETLTSELVARVAVDPPAVICIAAISPGGIAQARYLCKRLRGTRMNVPLVVGRWSQRQIAQTDCERLVEAGTHGITKTLLETRQWLNARYRVLGQLVPPAAEEPVTTRERSLAHVS